MPRHPERPDLRDAFVLGVFRPEIRNLVVDVKPFGADVAEIAAGSARRATVADLRHQ
ncbi:hypothetical protein [Streptomyces sp. NPDC001401]|uniref:hypothetical protein n=1 Tax=Streptomyces sp. NPDC001401 TaxID=3364570 RepID=UPI00367C4E5B